MESLRDVPRYGPGLRKSREMREASSIKGIVRTKINRYVRGLSWLNSYDQNWNAVARPSPPVPSPSAVIVRRSFSLSGHLRKCPCPSMSNRSASRIRRALGSAVTVTNKCGSVPSFGLEIPRCSLLVLRKSHFVRTTNECLISRSSATCMLSFGFGVASIGGSQGSDFLKNKANIGFSNDVISSVYSEPF